MTDEIMATVQAADLYLVLRALPPVLPAAERAAAERLRAAADDAARKL